MEGGVESAQRRYIRPQLSFDQTSRDYPEVLDINELLARTRFLLGLELFAWH